MIKRKPGVAAVSAVLLAFAGISLAGCDRDRADNAANPSATRTAANTKGTNGTNGAYGTNGTSVTPNATTSAPSPSTSGTTSNVTTGSGTMGNPDPMLTAKVKSSLLADPSVGGLKIDVDSANGTVTLNGNVKSQAEADRAVQLATATEGVKSVQSNLTVAR